MYTLTVTENQLSVISEACDLLARIKAGQYTALHGYMSMMDVGHVTWNMLLAWERSKVVKFVGDPVHIPMDIHQVLRHRLAWDRAYKTGIIKKGEPRKWPEMMTVDYDTPTIRSGEPKVVIE